jgi:hypothetical protein
MSMSRVAREAFLKMVRQQLQQPELSFDDAIKEPLAHTLFEMISRNLGPRPRRLLLPRLQRHRSPPFPSLGP